MAQIIKKSSDLNRSYTTAKTMTFAGFGGAALCFLGAAIAALRWKFPLFLLFAIGVMAGFVIGLYGNRNAEIYRCGIEGETVTANIVRHLSDSYYAIQNVNVSYQGKSSELDLVVVGPGGVFVVETKYLKGTVIGAYDRDQWELHKVGRGGTPYSKTFYSPVKQVGTHVFRLANFLRKKGENVWVDGIVCFSNSETEVCLQGSPDKIPVFSVHNGGAYDLCNYITGKGGNLSERQIQRIVQLLRS